MQELTEEFLATSCAATFSSTPSERAMAEQHSGLLHARTPSMPPAFWLAICDSEIKVFFRRSRPPSTGPRRCRDGDHMGSNRQGVLTGSGLPMYTWTACFMRPWSYPLEMGTVWFTAVILPFQAPPLPRLDGYFRESSSRGKSLLVLKLSCGLFIEAFGRPLFFFFFSTGVKQSTIIRSLTFRSGAHCGTPLTTLG